MPRLALVLIVVWFGTLFVFRSALQWWQTGSTGIKGFSGRVGSLEWSAGVLASGGLACGAIAPLATLYGWIGGDLLFREVVVHLLGAFVVVAGIAGALVAQMSMGSSWRVGVDEAETTALVTDGIFAYVRNPIFSFLMLSTLGLVLLLPSPMALLALMLTVVGIVIQVRHVEEPYLARVHGAAYRAYAARAGRFLPRFRRQR